jgi:chromate transporter
VQAFLTGAGAAAIGAIAGAAISLFRGLEVEWQYVVLAAAAAWLFALRRNVVIALLAAGLIGAVVAAMGGAVPR